MLYTLPQTWKSQMQPVAHSSAECSKIQNVSLFFPPWRQVWASVMGQTRRTKMSCEPTTYIVHFPKYLAPSTQETTTMAACQ